MNLVRIYHPALERYVDVPESAVPIHRLSGWVLADEAPPASRPVDETPVDETPAARMPSGDRKQTRNPRSGPDTKE